MTMNGELLLKILIHTRDSANSDGSAQVPHFSEFEPEDIDHHLRACEECGFIKLYKSDPLMDAPKGVIAGIAYITPIGNRQIQQMTGGRSDEPIDA